MAGYKDSPREAQLRTQPSFGRIAGANQCSRDDFFEAGDMEPQPLQKERLTHCDGISLAARQAAGKSGTGRRGEFGYNSCNEILSNL